MNPFPEHIKKLFWQILKEKYQDNEAAIEKIADGVTSANGYEKTAKLLIAVYESAYLKSVEEHKDILKAHGINAFVSNPKKEGPEIFKKN